jgi:hypothetical protein
MPERAHEEDDLRRRLRPWSPHHEIGRIDEARQGSVTYSRFYL